MADAEPKPSKLPSGLKTAGRKLWKEITGQYDLRPDEVSVFEEAARTKDLIDRLERIVNGLEEADFVVFGSRNQPVVHPLVSEIKSQRLAFASMMRQLGLPDHDAGEQDEAKGPMTRTEVARNAAKARWTRGEA